MKEVTMNILMDVPTVFDIDENGNVAIRYSVVEDRNTGKRYVYTEDMAIFTENGYCYEAMECTGGDFGKNLKIVEPLKFVCVAPIYSNGKYLGHVFTNMPK